MTELLYEWNILLYPIASGVGSVDVSILFITFESKTRVEGGGIILVVSDQNIFPGPFQSLSEITHTCSANGYYEYTHLVKCVEKYKFYTMLSNVPASQLYVWLIFVHAVPSI